MGAEHGHGWRICSLGLGHAPVVVGCMAAEPILDGDKKRKESSQAGGEVSRKL